MSTGDGVSFSAYIHPSNPDSGAYGGMSFVIFPIENGPCLVGMGIGTQGLSPDEMILSRPGHERKISAICLWINQKYGNGNLIAWSKRDPTRIDIDIPENIKKKFHPYQSVFDRYGKVMYAIFKPTEDKELTKLVVSAFLDLMFGERGFETLSHYYSNSQMIQQEYFEYIFPKLQKGKVEHILNKQHYVILEGPPGTGKTRLALQMLEEKFHGNGVSIQFHPNTTYENFIGGLSPTESQNEIGFNFKPKQGFLMDSIVQAQKDLSKPYLLHIDEINRADLGKVLGETIFLFESLDHGQRVINLPYNFGKPIYSKLTLPENLFILGTMNSSDRSIAIMDIAIRRRFSFVKLWPQLAVLENISCDLMKQAFTDLLSIFIEYASEDALSLVPGHAYFLEKDEAVAVDVLQTTLLPLLEEYLAQGYVSGFSEHILAYMQWLKSL
jgi:5-methylcytosine-specific restriction protein B